MRTLIQSHVLARLLTHAQDEADVPFSLSLCSNMTVGDLNFPESHYRTPPIKLTQRGPVKVVGSPEKVYRYFQLAPPGMDVINRGNTVEMSLV